MLKRKPSQTGLLFLAVMIGAVNADSSRGEDPQGENSESKAAERERSLDEMRALVDALRLSTASDRSRRITRIGEPVFRFESHTLDYSDGTLWVWGDGGRPLAFVKLFEYIDRWWHLFALSSTAELVAERAGATIWQPQVSEFKLCVLPRAATPAADANVRSRQMKDHWRRFTAHEFWNTADAKNERFDLRRLPKPLLRYQDEDASVVDGAALKWQYAVAPLGSAEFHVAIDGKEVYNREKSLRETRMPHDLYYVVGVPVNRD